MKKNKKIIMTGLIFLCIGGLAGCRVTGLEQTGNQDLNTAVNGGVQVEPANTGLQDDDSIYNIQDDTDVKTFYLTVTQGNQAESTNHTWKTVNNYETYYYDNQGIARYGVEGLLQAGDETGPLPGEIGYDDKTPNAIVTVRGQTSSYNQQKSYKIAIKDGKGSWQGQQIINLNKHQSDGVRFRNKMMYDLLRDMPDLISLRTQFVHLYVCDKTEGDNHVFQDYGLYTQVEQPNKKFLQSHGLDKNGQLYKINFFEFYRYEDVIKLKTDSTYDQRAFENMLEIKGDDDHSKLIAMLEDVNNDGIPIQQVLDKWFDEDNLLSWLSFQILTGNIDTQSRNTLLYSPLNVNKWYFINWDCDAAFENEESRLQGSYQENSWENGISNYWGNNLFKRMFLDTTIQKKLREKVEQQRAILTKEKIQSLVTKYAKITEPFAYADPDIGHEPITLEEFKQVCAAIPDEVEENYQKYLVSLDKPMPFFIEAPQVVGNTVKFSWTISYDFDAEDILYSMELARDYTFAEPVYEEHDIFLPASTYQGSLEPGQYFIRVKAKNESGLEQTAFDYYMSDTLERIYGAKCFYVLADGSIEVDAYE